MVSAYKFAVLADDPKYNKYKYSDLDCQAFVEKVLYDCGCRKSDGSAYNWRGSNSMWRNALSWKGTKAECIQKFGCIPVGAWVFQLVYDGGEKDRGYDDNEGNAQHVGIYVGDDKVRDSTRTKSGRDGVGTRSINDFNRIGLCKYLDYSADSGDNTIVQTILIVLKQMETEIERIRGLLDEI